jgi:hypothetical protein
MADVAGLRVIGVALGAVTAMVTLMAVMAVVTSVAVP